MSRRSNGEGSIFKRGDGRWTGAYYDSEFKRHYVYGKTQKEVRKKLKEKQAKVALKTNSYTLQDWIIEYLEKYKKNELKITTYTSYLGFYRKHILNSDIGKMKLDNLKAADLQEYYNEKLIEGYNSKTVRAIGIIINSALEKAYFLRMIQENPNRFTSLPKKKKYEARALTMEEVNTIVKNARDEKLYPIFVTAVYTGMRKGEIMALKWENVDLENRKIYVRGSLCRVTSEKPDTDGKFASHYEILEPKTAKSIRMIPMLDQVYEALVEQKRRQAQDIAENQEMYINQGFVFADEIGQHLQQRDFMKDYHKLLKKYGVPDVRFHDLRHTFATMLVQSDVSMPMVQQILGHSNIATSIDIYTHISEQKQEQVIGQLQKRINNEKQLE